MILLEFCYTRTGTVNWHVATRLKGLFCEPLWCTHFVIHRHLLHTLTLSLPNVSNGMGQEEKKDIIIHPLTHPAFLTCHQIIE